MIRPGVSWNGFLVHFLRELLEGLAMWRAALVVCLFAAGCAQQRAADAQARLNDAQVAFDREQAKCSQTYPAAVGTYLMRSNCIAPAQMALNGAKGLYVDFTQVMLATQAVLSGQLDRGEINIEQASLRLAELNSNLNERALRRRNEALAAMPPPPYIPMQQLQQSPIYTAPQRLQTTCQRIGQFTYCN